MPMQRELDYRIDRLVARLAPSCLSGTIDDRKGMMDDVLTALRLLDGLHDNGRLVEREKVRWLMEQATLRLTNRVEERLAHGPVDAAGKAAVREELAAGFEATMTDLEQAL